MDQATYDLHARALTLDRRYNVSALYQETRSRVVETRQALLVIFEKMVVSGTMNEGTYLRQANAVVRDLDYWVIVGYIHAHEALARDSLAVLAI